MSELNITEYENLGRDISGYTVPVGEEPSLGTQTITYTSTSVQSAVFNDRTRFLRIIADIDSRFAINSDPTADADSSLIPAGTVEYVGIKNGKQLRLAVIEL